MNGERPDEGGERDGPAPEGGGNGADGGARRPPGWIPPTRAGATAREHAEAEDDPPFGPGPSAPAINLPLPVLLLIVAFVVVHGVIHGLLAPMAARYVTLTLAFLPMRYALPAGVSPGDLPGGWASWMLSPVTHMFLHSGWGHLIINSVWLAAFGTPVARRLGMWRFLLLCALAAAAGALVYLALHWGEGVVLVGASGAISGLMGAAVRLLYAGGDTLLAGIRRDLTRVRPLPLVDVMRRSGPRTFIIIWLGINLVFGIWGLGLPRDAGGIAWEAHVGGFIAGLLLLGVIDRPSRAPGHGGRGATPDDVRDDRDAL